jgi:hypothetical protein
MAIFLRTTSGILRLFSRQDKLRRVKLWTQDSYAADFEQTRKTPESKTLGTGLLYGRVKYGRGRGEKVTGNISVVCYAPN